MSSTLLACPSYKTEINLGEQRKNEKKTRETRQSKCQKTDVQVSTAFHLLIPVI
jgi:hypothetical protein